MHLLACGVKGDLFCHTIVSRTLEVCYIRTLLAELIQFIWCQRIVTSYNICRYHLTANLVRHRCHDAVLNLWMGVEHSLYLRRIDILTRRD